MFKDVTSTQWLLLFTSATLYPSNFASLDRGDITLKMPAYDVTVAALPMFHQFGILMFLTHALTMGFKLIVMARFELNLYLKYVEVHRVSGCLLHLII
jgi:acyl-CoA synthetase (AMP-forming)/AMP-acid ligase II